VFAGVPVTFGNAVRGTISNAQPFIENQVNVAAATGSATESGCSTGPCTPTITTATPHGFSPGQTVRITGVGAPGYNGMYTILTTPTLTTFTYTNPVGGLPDSGGGTASVPTGQATATYTATGCNTGSADAAVDGQTVTASLTLQCPDLT